MIDDINILRFHPAIREDEAIKSSRKIDHREIAEQGQGRPDIHSSERPSMELTTYAAIHVRTNGQAALIARYSVS